MAKEKLTREEYDSLWKAQMIELGYSEDWFRDSDVRLRFRYISYSDCMNDYMKAKGWSFEKEDGSPCSCAEICDMADIYIADNIPEQFPGEEEPYTDETLELWYNNFIYEALRRYEISRECKWNEL